MKLLLYTNVVTELRKAKTGKINSNLKDLADKVAPTNLFISDALIAATAIVYSMTIVTRNLADFKPTGLQIVNPWEV